MNKITFLLIFSIVSVYRANAEDGVWSVPDGSASTYWTGMYPWCSNTSELFVCKRNVRIVPMEGVQQLSQLGLLWKERTTVSTN